MDVSVDTRSCVSKPSKRLTRDQGLAHGQLIQALTFRFAYLLHIW